MIIYNVDEKLMDDHVRSGYSHFLTPTEIAEIKIYTLDFNRVLDLDMMPHSSDSKQCPKWKAEKEIQAIKTNRNISYLEARKLIAPQLSETYAQVAKPSTVTSTTQTDENLTQIKCPPLQLLQPLLSVPQPDKSNSVFTLSSATQADLLLSTSSIAATISEPPHLIPVSDTLLSTTSTMFTPIEPSSSIISASTSNSSIQPPSAFSTQNF
ncbi:uncharacterized protein TNCV_5034551 [Trichonephila clavipes]|nr:uncharacterized protein TNCV_5034551 [Trichonephila clavipes]